MTASLETPGPMSGSSPVGPMSGPVPVTRAASGAEMDRIVTRRRLPRWAVAAGALATLALAGAAVWALLPRGVPVARGDVDIAAAALGTFRDELASRATVAPLSSVMLDATEGGRVEAVHVRDGARVSAGELLFRLSNPQRAQEVMARSADMAQQLANLSGMRAQLAATRLAHRREVANAEFELERLGKTHARNVDLAKNGFLSNAAVEESADKLQQQRRLLAQLRADGEAELVTREQSVAQMDGAIAGLTEQLRLTRASAEALAVRAPVAGLLTGFTLQQGESVKPNDRVGRIDSADAFKLTAQVDEFYLPRLGVGVKGTVSAGGRELPVTVTRIDPQVKDARFGVELAFEGAPGVPLQAGQALDLRLALGQPGQALLLPDAGFYADSGGAWVYVLSAGGTRAERRPVRTGRRAAGQVEVLGGLKPGEQAIVSSVRRFGDAPLLRINP